MDLDVTLKNYVVVGIKKDILYIFSIYPHRYHLIASLVH